MQVKLKINFFKLDKDIFLCCAYIPSTNSKHFNDGEDKVLDLLKQDIEKYSNLGNIILFGDLNCRLGEKQEELSFIDSDCEDQDYLNTIEIPNTRWPKKYSCLNKRKMNNKRGIFKIKISLNFQ